MFGYEHKQMKEMIRRFDELLADKANKMSLIELEYKVSENYLLKKAWEKMQDKF